MVTLCIRHKMVNEGYFLNYYSPADQKERLIKYCDQQRIEIVAFYHDDESGKSFDRPEWINIMTFHKKEQRNS